MRHFLDVLHTLFGWPAGIVLGNLIASLAWLPIQWVGLHLKLRSHQSALHARLDVLEAKLDRVPGPDLLRRHDKP